MRQLNQLKSLLRPYWLQIILSAILLLVLVGVDIAMPAIIQQVIDNGLLPGQMQFLITSALVVLGLGLGKAILRFVQGYLNAWIANRLAFDLRNRLYDHIQHLPFGYHDHTQSGQLISRVIEDVRAIQGFGGHGVIELARMAVMIVGITILIFATNARLAAIAMLPILPLAILTTSFGKRIGRLFYKVDHTLGDLSSRLQENVIGVQVVRAFARETEEVRQFNTINRQLFDAQINVVKSWGQTISTSNLLITACTILILWFGGQMVFANELTLGELVAFNGYVLLVAGPIQQLAWLVNAAGEAQAGLQRTFEVLETKPEIASPPDGIRLPVLRGQVTFNNVSFKYTGEKIPALHDIHLDVQPNQMVALIGPTGSGKTSLINLIPRFYDVTRGCVCVDGVDVRRVDLDSLRRQIGIVLQTSLLFSASIRENLAYGRPDASLEEIIAAAKAAQAHEFILELPNGYDTIIGERGVTLSGGQRQRIAIGRALLMDPRILILDDSTSSVDTQTEALIQKALHRLMENRTTFVIAQRLSTVRRADLILVLDHGRIVERGTHAELLQQGGLYAQIYELQLRDQEELQETLDGLHLSEFTYEDAGKRATVRDQS